MWCTEGRVRKHSAICPDSHRPLGYSLSRDPYTGRSAGLNPPDLWLFIEFKLALLELRPLAVTLLSRKWRLTILGKRLVPAHSQTSEQKGPLSHLCNGQMIVACCTRETYGNLSAALGMTHSSSVQFQNSPSRVLSELWVKGCGKQLLASHGHCYRTPAHLSQPAPCGESLHVLWITPECPCSSCSHLFSVENKSGHSSICSPAASWIAESALIVKSRQRKRKPNSAASSPVLRQDFHRGGPPP